MKAGEQFDVAIAGAGPAGSSAAIRLAEAGLRVVLLERKQFPRHKLCGEFVSPECLDHLTELGVDLTVLGASAIERTVFYARSGRQLTIPTSWLRRDPVAALGVSRAAMDQSLLDRAREVGVDVREGTSAKRVESSFGAVTGLRVGGSGTVEAPIVIDARGRSRSFINNEAQARRPAKYVAFKAHLTGVRSEGSICEMFVYRGGYGGCLPVEGGLHNLCFIAPASTVAALDSDPEKFMRTVLMRNRRAADVLAAAQLVGDWYAVPVEGLGPKEPVPARGLLAIGDAAAFIDPFTGSGILLALQSGKLAAESIVSNFPDPVGIGAEYRKRYAAAFNERLKVSSILRHAFMAPAAAEIALTVLGSSERALRHLASATRSGNPAGT